MVPSATMLRLINSYRQLSKVGKQVRTLWNGETFKEYPSISTWNEPLPHDEIEAFLISKNWWLPSDYREFLQVCNGCTLFAHPEYGGGTQILDLNRIARIHEEMNLPKHWIPIAWTDGIIGSICMDSEQVRAQQHPYLYFLDAMDNPEQAIPLRYDFTTWLIRLIETQGHEFWLWEKYDKLKFD